MFNVSAQTIVLVHGAWVDGAAWDKVAPLLKAKGHEVIIVELPGHGKDNTPANTLHLQTYVDAVKKAIGNRKNVLLVGHSMAGMVISEVAEQIPAQIKTLVYVGAFLPRNGENLLKLSGQDKDSHLGKFLQVDQQNGTGSFTPEGIRDVFAAQVPEADFQQLAARRRPEPLGPLGETVTLTDENFGKVDKAYVFTVNDKANSYSEQQQMVNDGHVNRFYALPSDHVPFLSMPDLMAAVLLQEAR